MKLVPYAILVSVTLLALLMNTTAMTHTRTAADTALYYALYDATTAGMETAKKQMNEELYGWPVLNEGAAHNAFRAALADAPRIGNVCYREYGSRDWKTSADCPVIVDYKIHSRAGPGFDVRDLITGDVFRPPYPAIQPVQSLLGNTYGRPAIEAIVAARVPLPLNFGMLPYTNVVVRKAQEAWLPGSLTSIQ